MVKRCTEEQWKQQFSHPWVLLENLEGVSFPLYHDEIQTEAKFLARTQDAFTRSDEEMLLFMEQGKALGWAHTYWIPQDRYLGLVSMAVPRNFGDALGQLLDYWGRQFPGYQWDAYFPQENKEAHRVLQSRGMKPQVQEAVGVLLFDQYHPRPENSRIAKLDREHFHLFRQVHQREEGKMYWTSDRIFATLEDWALYGYVQQGKCVAVLYYKGVGTKNLEIFGLDFIYQGEPLEASEVGRALLVSALNQAKKDGAKSMYFFHDPRLTEIVEETGFQILTTAVAYGGTVPFEPASPFSRD